MYHISVKDEDNTGQKLQWLKKDVEALLMTGSRGHWNIWERKKSESLNNAI
jgi:hypothetical protein